MSSIVNVSEMLEAGMDITLHQAHHAQFPLKYTTNPKPKDGISVAERIVWKLLSFVDQLGPNFTYK